MSHIDVRIKILERYITLNAKVMQINNAFKIYLSNIIKFVSFIVNVTYNSSMKFAILQHNFLFNLQFRDVISHFSNSTSHFDILFINFNICIKNIEATHKTQRELYIFLL